MRYFFHPVNLFFTQKEDQVFVESWTEEVVVEEGRPGGPSFDGEQEPEGGWPYVPEKTESVFHEAYTKTLSNEEFSVSNPDLEGCTEMTELQFNDFLSEMNNGAPKILGSSPDGMPSFTLDDVFVETEETVALKRLAAYRTESDPLKIEAEYDAIKQNKSPDYSAWIAKVEQIKQQFPFP